MLMNRRIFLFSMQFNMKSVELFIDGGEGVPDYADKKVGWLSSFGWLRGRRRRAIYG